MEWTSEITEPEHIRSLSVSVPTQQLPYFQARVRYETSDGETDSKVQRWIASDGQRLDEREEGLAQWILGIHRYLMWPNELGGNQIGRGLSGIAGVVMLLSIITGIIAHTKISKEMFALRFHRSVRLKWQDTHKVLGLWTAPFSILMSLTGAITGIVVIFAPVLVLLIAHGDMGRVVEAMGQERIDRSGVPAEMMSIDDMIAIAKFEHEGTLTSLDYAQWGDQNARVTMNFKSADQLKLNDPIVYGAVLTETPASFPATESPTGFRLSNGAYPLHYGNYGGIALKLLYFVLGLAMSIVVILGIMMWLERRIHGNEGSRSVGFYRGLSRLTVGVGVGIPLATIAVFHSDKLLYASTGSSLEGVGWVYFLAIIGSIIFAFIRSNEYCASRELTGVLGALSVLAPISNMAVTGDVFLFDLFDPVITYAWVDIFFLIVGFACMLVAWKMPSHRKEPKKVNFEPAPELL